MKPLHSKLLIAAVTLVVLGVSCWFAVTHTFLRVLVWDFAYWAGIALDSTTSDVLRRMDRYEKQHRYDATIKAGIAWTTKHPGDGRNDAVFSRIAAAYLWKAQTDSAHAEEHTDKAIAYRDRALSVVQDDLLVRRIWALRASAYTTESAGDISAKQRCFHYNSALTFQGRLLEYLNEEQVQATHPNPASGDHTTLEEVRKLLDDAHLAIFRVREKQVEAGCPTPQP